MGLHHLSHRLSSYCITRIGAASRKYPTLLAKIAGSLEFCHSNTASYHASARSVVNCNLASTTRNCWRTMVPGLELGMGSANISTAKPPWRDGLNIFAYLCMILMIPRDFIQLWFLLSPISKSYKTWDSQIFASFFSGSCWIHKPIFSGQKWSKHLKPHQHEHCLMLGRPRQDVACGTGAGDGVPCRAVLGLHDPGLLEEWMGWMGV